MIHGPDATDDLIIRQTRELVREAMRLLKDSDGRLRAQRVRDTVQMHEPDERQYG